MIKSIVVCIVFLFIVAEKVQSIHYQLTAADSVMVITPYKDYHYAAFNMGKPTQFTLECDEPVNTIDISPKSKKIKGQIVTPHKLSFTIDSAGYYLIRINEKNKFFIFADKPETAPQGKIVNILSLGVDNTGLKNETSTIQKAINKSSNANYTLFFPRGIYKINSLQMRSNSRIHLARGAVLLADTKDINAFTSDNEVNTKRFISFDKVKNIRITGYGEINLNGRDLRTLYGDKARMRLLLFVKSSDITLDGLFLKDPGSWNTQLIYSDHIILRHIKMMNDVDVSNTDGFDPDASQDIVVDNCFAYCGDDNVAIKTTNSSELSRDVNNITITNNVFLTKKSSLKIGTETRCNKISNVLFENNDVIESDRGMAIYCSDGAEISNISFINNHFETCYPDGKRACINVLVNQRRSDSKIGSIKNVLVKGCLFYEAFPRKSEIKTIDASRPIDVLFDNLTIAGKKIASTEDMGIDVTNANIHFQ